MADASASQDQQVRLHQASGRWVLFATVLGSGLAGIDATVVNIALPRDRQRPRRRRSRSCSGPSTPTR